MGRKLPWKTSPTQSISEKQPSLKSESPNQTPSHLSNPAIGSSSTSTKPRHNRVVESEDSTRSPSTSPPPEPPQERFMRPGLDHDDRYRMVEDEFLNMAHQFTVHLHRAEYERLKNLAKHQNADTIREIERPIVGPLTFLARQRKEAAHRVSKQCRLLADSFNEKVTPFAGSNLQGLMESPRKEHKWISAGLADAAKTRASAGFDSQKITPSRIRQNEKPNSGKKRQLSLADEDETDDGEDLDLSTPSRKPVVKAACSVHTLSPVVSRSAPRQSSSTPQTLSTTTNKTSPSGSSVKRPTTAPGDGTHGIAKRSDVHEDIDDDDIFGITKRMSDRRRSRVLNRRMEDKVPAKSSLDEIPSFI